MRKFKVISAFFVFMFFITNISLVSGSRHFIQWGAQEAWGQTTNSTVVNQPYDISGNGGRKFTSLSNGWLVVAYFNPNITSNKTYVFMISKDNGTSWSQLCSIGYQYDASHLAICSYGTTVFCLCTDTGTAPSKVYCVKFNAMTVTNVDIGATAVLLDTQWSLGTGSSITADSEGNIHAVWCSKNSAYSNSFNLRYSKSTDGGVSWMTPTQVTTLSSNDMQTPCIVTSGTNVYIVATFSAGYKFILIFSPSGLSIVPDSNFAWSRSDIYNGYAYAQECPCVVVSSDGCIHVVWQGKGSDMAYEGLWGVRYSRSIDGGRTWSSMFKASDYNTYNNYNPSIAADDKNHAHIVYTATCTGVYQLKKVSCVDGIWSNPIYVTSATASQDNPQLCSSNIDFISPLLIWKDTQTGAIKYTGEIGSTKNDESTTLLMHFNAMNSFKDELSHTVIQGDTKIDTNIFKFGGASANFDGRGYLTVDDTNDFAFGTGDFTIDGWIYIPSTFTGQRLTLFSIGQKGWGQTYKEEISCCVTDGKIQFMAENTFTFLFNIIEGAIPLNHWVHLAYVRSNGTMFAFINGVKTSAVNCNYNFTVSSNIRIGDNYINGIEVPDAIANYKDEIRVTKGIALWDSDFTPPTKEYSPYSCMNTILVPSQNSSFSELDTGVVPKIEVSNSKNDTLTCKMYIDEETMPRDTKVVAGTKTTTQTAIFSPVNMSKLSEGQHTMKFDVSSGGASSQSTVDFKVDKSPTIGSIAIDASETSITASAIAADCIGLSATTPFSISIGDYSKTMTPVGNNTTSSALVTRGALACNTLYPITFKAKDTAGHETVHADDVYTKAVTPTLSAITGPTNIDIAVGGQNPANTEYQMMCNNKYVTASGTLTSTPTWAKYLTRNVNVKGLTPQTEYTLKIKARNGDGIETDSYFLNSGIPVATQQKSLDKPLDVVATTGEDGITVTWEQVEGATGYKVSVDDSTPSGITTDTYYIHHVLDAIEHKYKVMAVREGETGLPSDPVYATAQSAPLSSPASITATISPAAITLDWNAVTGATGYELEMDGEKVLAGFKYYKDNLNNTKVRYVHNGLSLNSQHTYKVRAWRNTVAGEWSSLLVAKTGQEAPGTPVIKPVAATDTTITITWDPVPGAQEYEVIFDGITYKNGKNTNFIMYGLHPKTSHTYTVKALNYTDVSTNTVTASGSKDTYDFATPQVISFTEDVKKITLTWSPVTGATGYEIVRAAQGQTKTINIADTTYIDTDGLEANKKYSYQIRATASGKYSAPCDPVVLESLPDRPGVPGSITVTATQDIITLNWAAVTTGGSIATGAINYDVMIDGVEVDNDDQLNYVDDALMPNTIHKYRIRSKDNLIESDWSSEIIVKTLPSKPITPRNITVVSSSTNVKLSWIPQDGDLSYDIQVWDSVPSSDANATETGITTLLATVNGITKNEYIQRGDTGTINLQEYMYRIRTHNMVGVSDWSGYIVNNTIKAHVKKADTTNLALTATDVTDFSQYTMTVTYNKDVLDVLDLSMQTGAKELQAGNITGTAIVITSFEPGRITFRVDKAVTPGEAWTGVINSIQFKAKVNGGTFISYTVIGKPDDAE